jgi:anti-anti-sigma factor
VEFRIDETSEPGVLVVSGDIDVAVADRFERALGPAGGIAPMTIDLAGVTFMDSSGLRAILRAATRVTEAAPLVLRNPSAPVQRLFEITLPQEFPHLRIERRPDDG